MGRLFETAIQPDLAGLLGAIDLSVVRVNQAWVLTTMRKDGPALIRLLWRMLGREDDVLDAYQDCFCKLIAYSEKTSRRPNRAAGRSPRCQGDVPIDAPGWVVRVAPRAILLWLACVGF